MFTLFFLCSGRHFCEVHGYEVVDPEELVDMANADGSMHCFNGSNKLTWGALSFTAALLLIIAA